MAFPWRFDPGRIAAILAGLSGLQCGAADGRVWGRRPREDPSQRKARIPAVDELNLSMLDGQFNLFLQFN